MKRKTKSRIILALFLLAIIPLYSVATQAEFILPPTTLQDPNPEAFARFGESVAVGDVNNDGYDDVVVGARNSEVDGYDNAGEAFVFLGPAFTTVTTLQDPNPEEDAWFGYSGSLAVGDVNNDGYDDVVVGAYASDVAGLEAAGEVFVFFGPAFTTVTTLQDPNPEYLAWFGSSLAVGDVDHDGYDDVVVGAYWSEVDGVDTAGEAFVFLGPALTTVTTLQDPNPEENALFGESLAVGDVDHDGYDDVVVGAYMSDIDSLLSAGEAFVFFGPALTTVTTLQDPNPEAVADFGSPLAVGDVNNDGYDDVVVGAYWSDVAGYDYAGEAFVFFGPALTTVTTLQDPNPEAATFGYSLAVGDVNNDGYDDVVVGAPISDVDSLLSAGEAFVFFSQARIPVYIDIKPGSWPNPLNLKAKGVLPVAICGTEDFDVTTIDPPTVQLTLEGLVVGVAPLRWSYEDVATPYTGEPCSGHDLDGDGYLDLTLKFKTQEVIQTLGLAAFSDRDVVVLILNGNLKVEHGGTPIQGQDCVVILKSG